MSKRFLLPSVLAVGLAVAVALVVFAAGAPVLGNPKEPYPTPPAWAPPQKYEEGLTPTATAIPPAGPECPLDDGVCAAAEAFRAVLNTHSPEAILAALRTTQRACEPAVTNKQPDPACDGLRPGDIATGYWYFGPKQANLMTRDALIAELERRLARAPLSFALVAVACPGNAAAQDCSQYAAATVAAPRSDGTSLVFLVPLELDQGSGNYVPVGIHYRTDLTGSYARGGVARTSFPAADYPEEMWFIPWDPGR